MPVISGILNDHAAPAARHGWRDAWRGLVVRCRTLDILAAMTAASLPWSTTAPAILIVLWLVVLVPTIEWDAFACDVSHPACALRLALTAGWLALLLAFVVNMMFVITARTALVYMPVLLVLFAVLHLSRRPMLALFAAVAVAAVLVWSTSPHLRQRIADVATEYRG